MLGYVWVVLIGLAVSLFVFNRFIGGAIGEFLCEYMGWHVIYSYDSFDGASAHATCVRCKFEGMIDSQGNLF